MSKRAESCDLQSASFIPHTTFPGKAFKPRWIAATESLELEVLVDIIQPGPLRVEVIGAITLPLQGVTGDAGVRWSFLPNSPARPTGVVTPTPYSARSPITATAFDTLQQVGSLTDVQLSFDTVQTMRCAVTH